MRMNKLCELHLTIKNRFRQMKALIKKEIILLFATLITIVAIMFLNQYADRYTDRSEIRDNVEQELFYKSAEIKRELRIFADRYNEENESEDKLSEYYYNSLIDKGITIIARKNNKTIYWTDNDIITEKRSYDDYDIQQIIKYNKNWYISNVLKKDSITFFAFFKLKKGYKHHNHLLQDSYHSDISLPAEADIILDKYLGYPIYTSRGGYLFSISFPTKIKVPIHLQSLIIFIFSISLVLGLSWLWIIIAHTLKVNQTLKLVIFIVSVVVIRAALIIFKWPNFLYETELFQSFVFASSTHNPSLGDFFISTICLTVILLTIYNRVKTYSFDKVNGLLKNTFILLLFAGMYGAAALLKYMFKILIFHSTKEFLMFDFVQMNIFTLIGFLIMVLFLGNFSLLSRILLYILGKFESLKRIIIWIVSITILLIFPVIHFFGYIKLIELMLLASFIISLTIYIKRHYGKEFRYNLVLMSILAVIGLYLITALQYDKQIEDAKLIAGNLSNERDAVLETIISSTEESIISDEKLPEFLTDVDKYGQDIYNHIVKNYLSGYYNKYDIQITCCYSGTELIIDPTKAYVNCNDFFDTIIDKYGFQIPFSNFYYNNNHNGRVSYVGNIKLPIANSKDSANVYIELDSKLQNKYLGYPELLLKTNKNMANLKGFSYANYYNNHLVSYSGEFDFPEIWETEPFDKKNKFKQRLKDKQIQCTYQIEPNNTIVLVRSFIVADKVLYLFTHLFIGIYVFFLIVYYKSERIQLFFYVKSLQGKLKLSIISVLVLSLLLIGFGTIRYSANTYEKTHFDNLNEKVRSITVELSHKISHKDAVITDNSEYLTYWLIRFSNVFYTDINMYDTKGNIMASSRNEIFKQGLLSKKMNPLALNSLSAGNRKYFCKENIGELTYHSIYVPFTNNMGEPLAYINIPYFTRQNELQNQLYELINAGVNIFLMLILIAISIAIILSNQISKPLRMLQEGLSKLSIGEQNLKLTYNKNDEISALVTAYNNKVRELDESINKLTEKEREEAWKKMARQIAHEIKNPLTPMKLRVQFLERAWKDRPEDWDKQLKRFTETMIQQIDSLTYIANEFSNFSKLSEQNPTDIDPKDIINNIVDLYSNTDVQFIKQFDSDNRVISDAEHLPRVFINIIKNAISAIPEERQGIIEIGFYDLDDSFVEFFIKDNGKGISGEDGEKIFEPNFTTKTSGMGLGLSIVKNIIETSGGKIRYNTIPGKGTTFFFTLLKVKR